MARVARTMDVDLRFGDPACEFEHFRTDVRPGVLCEELQCAQMCRLSPRQTFLVVKQVSVRG